MPRNQTTGIFTRVDNSFSNPVFGTVIDPTDAIEYFDDIDEGLTFNDASPLILVGSTSGVTKILAADAASGELTLPAGTTDFSGTGGTAQFVRQDSVGGPFTVTTVPASGIASPQALTRVDDTNVTLTLGGTPSTALLQAVSITAGWSGRLGLSRGGTNADLSATGGSAQYLKQSSAGAAVTVGTIPASDIASPGALTKTDDTNVTLTLGGSPAVALLAATSVTVGWSGQLAVSRGGTGAASQTAYAVLCGGTTSTGAYQSIASVGSTGNVLMSNGAGALPTMQGLTNSITFIIDGGGATITTGVKGDLVIPFGGTITQWTLLGDQSGSIVVDIWKDTYANYPPTVADTITGSAKPTISTATKGQSSTLSGWTTTISAGDTLRFNVDSVTDIQRVTLSLKVTRTTA